MFSTEKYSASDCVSYPRGFHCMETNLWKSTKCTRDGAWAEDKSELQRQLHRYKNWYIESLRQGGAEFFLETLFLKIGFHSKWVSWIMCFVRSVTYTLMMNGQSYEHIVQEREIWQGDPLSPFLFILCDEALVNIMNRVEQNGDNTWMKLARSFPSVQHLLLQTIAFLLSSESDKMFTFLKCMWLHGSAFGQEINFQKSSITYGADVDPIMRILIANILIIDNEGGIWI